LKRRCDINDPQTKIILFRHERGGGNLQVENTFMPWLFVELMWTFAHWCVAPPNFGV
jgi:hypothetical protein